MTGHPGPAEILADKTESAGMFDSLGRYVDRLYVMTLSFVFNEIATTFNATEDNLNREDALNAN